MLKQVNEYMKIQKEDRKLMSLMHWCNESAQKVTFVFSWDDSLLKANRSN